MRKLFVALLILSVMGGAFAQEKGSWGTLSGEATLNTGFYFVPDPVEVGGEPSDVEFAITYENTFGPFSLKLPLVLKGDRFGTATNDDGDKLGLISYESGSLTVELPFGFLLDQTEIIPPFLPIGSADSSNDGAGVDFKATYDDGTFGFKIGYNNLLEGPELGAIGGFYKFMDGASQLYVSKGAYETKWWRASSYVLEPSFGFYNTFDGSNEVIPLIHDGDEDDYWNWEFKWENVKDNGIAYQYFVMPELSIGLAFNGGNLSPFKGVDSINDDDPMYGGVSNDLVDVYLKRPVFGAKYDNETFAASAMLALRPDEDTNKSDILIAAGASFLVMPELKINADISVGIWGDTDYKPDPMFNAGVEVSYTSDTFFAGLGFKGLNLAADTKAGSNNYNLIGLEFVLGYNKVKDGYVFDGENQGFFAGLNGHFNLISAEKYSQTDFGLGFNIGYKEYALTEKMLLSVTGELGLEAWGIDIDGTKDDASKINFEIKPVLKWNVFDNGSITFEYKLGSTNLDADPALNVNELAIKFKWWL